MSSAKKKQQQRHNDEQAKKKESDAFNCGVCHAMLRDPVSLQCGHSFCETCLAQCFLAQIESSSRRVVVVRCPYCRSKCTGHEAPRVNQTLKLAIEQLSTAAAGASSSTLSDDDDTCHKTEEEADLIKLFREKWHETMAANNDNDDDEYDDDDVSSSSDAALTPMILSDADNADAASDDDEDEDTDDTQFLLGEVKCALDACEALKTDLVSLAQDMSWVKKTLGKKTALQDNVRQALTLIRDEKLKEIDELTKSCLETFDNIVLDANSGTKN